MVPFLTEIRLRVDRRTTLSQLKEKLEPSVGVPSSNFKVREKEEKGLTQNHS